MQLVINSWIETIPSIEYIVKKKDDGSASIMKIEHKYLNHKDFETFEEAVEVMNQLNKFNNPYNENIERDNK